THPIRPVSGPEGRSGHGCRRQPLQHTAHCNGRRHRTTPCR
ncbi:Uncharacterized protein HZ326_30303, partial [Fusarium oxysporum f. sp. albedinis]